MGELKSSIILDLAGNIESRSRQFSNSINGMATRGSKSFRLLQGSVRAFGNGLDRLGNRYTALLTGAAGYGTLRMVANLSERMTQLGVDAGLTAEGVDRLRQKVIDVSRMPDIRIDPTELLSAIEQIIRDTGDLPFAERNLRTLGLTIRATAGTGKDIGAMATELEKLNKAASSEEILKAIDIFNAQGKAGAVALRDLAEIGPRTFAAYASMRKGADPATFVREIGAALQTIKGGAGDVRNAATSFEALMRVFSDAKRIQAFRRAGIQIFDPVALKQGREELRPINELMSEIVEKTKGRATLLDYLIPDAEAKRALTVQDLRENIKRYYQVEADGSATTADAARNAAELNAVLTSLSASWKDIASRNLTKPFREVADVLGSIDKEKVDLLFKAGTALAVGTGGAIVGRKIYNAGRGIASLLGKGGAAGKLAGAAGFGDAIPVYVVNGPASIWPGAGVEGASGATVLKASPLAGAAATVTPLIPAAVATIAAAGSMAIGKAIAESQASSYSKSRLQELLMQHSVLGGGPGSYQARLITAELNRRNEVDVGGTITIKFDGNGRPVVKEITSRNPRVDLDVDSGRLFRSH